MSDDQFGITETADNTTSDTDLTETAGFENDSTCTESTESVNDGELNAALNTKNFLLPQDILSLSSRHIRTEDPEWALSSVPELSDIIVQTAYNVKGPELKNFIENANDEQKKHILGLLPLNIPFKYTLSTLGTGKYWERQCLERWSPTCIWRYHDDWKRMFVERAVEDYIENFVPGESDTKQLEEFLRVFSEYNFRLKIRHLQKRVKKPVEVDLSSEDFDEILDDIIAEPESESILLNFELVLGCLVELKEFTLSLTPSSLDNDTYRLSTSDFNSLLRGLRKLQKLEKFRCCNGVVMNDQLIITSSLFLEQQFLKELNLSYNFIDDSCCDYIGKLLMSSCPLEVLVLKYNRIADDGAVIIASALSVNDKLKRLDVSLNWIGERGGEFLAKVISSNTVVEDLDISKNKLGPEAGQAFADAVKTSKSLLSLNIAENNIGEESGHKFKEAMKWNQSLLYLDMHFCNFSPTDEDAIYRAFIRNRSELKLPFTQEV